MLMLGKNNWIVNLFIILLAVAPAFALGNGNMNMLLVSAMCLSPYFIFRFPIIIGKIDFPLLALGIMMIAFPMLLHPETMRWSTVLYSCLFFTYFISYTRVLYNSNYGIENFCKIACDKNYFAFSIISTTLQCLSLDSGRVSITCTLSPIPHALFSSWALNVTVRFKIFL